MITKTNKALLMATGMLTIFVAAYSTGIFSSHKKNSISSEHIHCSPEKHVCVMKTIFNLEDEHQALIDVNDMEFSQEAKLAINSGLSWMEKAQLPDGGWGAGTHSRQDLRDPHAVAADPATTSLVGLSLLRTGNSLDSGTYKQQVIKATDFLLKKVEEWPAEQKLLTTLTSTQPQSKLGQNIDAILTVQYLTTLLKYEQQHAWKERIEKALQKCISRIEKEQDSDGGWKGGGWAPVLQSALADQALESAKDMGFKVDTMVMYKSKNYQKGNFDTATKSAVTGKAAGVMLYSLSSTTRSSAKEAKKARQIVEKAKKEGKLKNDNVTSENLTTAGLSAVEARELEAAYNINTNAQYQSMDTRVMQGFGSNGGEEFISFLMTGESLFLQGGETWKKWYDNTSKMIISIQKKDGSWEGHHCITSPVFCTAAALLILSIHNDMAVAFEKGF